MSAPFCPKKVQRKRRSKSKRTQKEGKVKDVQVHHWVNPFFKAAFNWSAFHLLVFSFKCTLLWIWLVLHFALHPWVRAGWSRVNWMREIIGWEDEKRKKTRRQVDACDYLHPQHQLDAQVRIFARDFETVAVVGSGTDGGSSEDSSVFLVLLVVAVPQSKLLSCQEANEKKGKSFPR